MIAIIDYKAGNLRSVARALSHVGVSCSITSDRSEIVNAERVIFPGVGAAGSAMESIRSCGLEVAIREVVARGTPFLGICLGAQVILSESEEDGGTGCIGIIPGTVRRFEDKSLKVPHMGWNSISVNFRHPVLRDIDARSQFYFVHSYYPDPKMNTHVFASTEYGAVFPSVIGRDNVIATQFHPEKSGESGLKILRNFSRWDGGERLC